MTYRLISLALFLWFCQPANAQDTFSIVAVDTATGEVGSAGATCLDVNKEGVSAIIISDVIPGKGAIHTQSFWNPSNQQNARNRMLLGDSPQDLMTWLQTNDEDGNPGIRQYGAVDIAPTGEARAAAFTGASCLDAKGHRVGEHYAIQGNILLGEAVLDSMEARFLAAKGSLAERLMAAMQGANVPGADSRCLTEGVSSRSAFLRIARPGDPEEDLYLDIRVDATPFGVEPIDSLQTAFDTWLLTTVRHQVGSEALEMRLAPNPSAGTVSVWLSHDVSGGMVYLLDARGVTLHRQAVVGRTFQLEATSKGWYWVVLRDLNGRWLCTKKWTVHP